MWSRKVHLSVTTLLSKVMSKKSNLIFSNQGFTLVELMVVVAIIGLLSAVAIPNFQKYQARTKTAEAKLQLSSIYAAEQSFYASYNIYHTCLRYMGYDPEEQISSRYYTVGFNVTAGIDDTMYASATNSGLNAECPDDLTVTPGTTATAYASHYLAGKKVATGLASVAALGGTSMGSQANESTQVFTAGAAGIIHKKFATDALSSYMTIDQAKVIRNVRNGF